MNNGVPEILIYLLACAVNGFAPDYERVKNVDLNELLYHSKRHSVAAIIAYALEDAGFDKELLTEFSEEKGKAIRKNILYKNELQEIGKFLSENGIWYMPLKGAVLMDLYPKIGMRQMSDIDIYFDKSYAPAVTDFMVARGYDAVNIAYEMHDIYQKKPFFDIEFHKALVSKYSHPQIALYYKNVLDKLITDESDKFKKSFSPEDFYIYMLVHAAKHYFTGGTGIRTFLDFFVFLKHFGNKLDTEYIKSVCEKIELSEFERDARLLANTVFSGDSYVLTESQEKMLGFTLDSGTYGNYENTIISKLNAINSKNNKPISKLKGKYVFRRIFPDLKYMQTYYLILNKCKYLLPFVWIYRLIYKSIVNFKGAYKEIKTLKKIK